MRLTIVSEPRKWNKGEESIMADEKEGRTCANPTCSCKVQDGQKFCSTSCEGKGKVVELDCECGHPQCSGDF